MRRTFDQIYWRMGIRQLRGLIVLGTDHQTLLGLPPFVSLTDIFLAKNMYHQKYLKGVEVGPNIVHIGSSD